MNTIVALSTPAGNSGVAVIRISGEKSKEILQKITHSNQNFEPRKMYLKKVFINDYFDNCLVVYFCAPFSYTGEDVVEIQSHGGYFLAQQIIKECISLGAVYADTGEFSKRAFLNGKISIDQAEGIMDLINAETEAQARIGANLLDGKLRERINKNQMALTDILAEIEAKLDYPEYDFELEEKSNTKTKIQALIDDLNDLIQTTETGSIIKNGVKVAIIGPPNVGKSSLLNTLTNSEKAIVTDIAGTTRDVVEAEYIYNGIIFRLYDTAGIHKSTDIVENIGIERAKNTLNNADLVLRIHDNQQNNDIKTTKPTIDIYNKSDLIDKKDAVKFYISTKTGENIHALKQLIFDKTVKTEIDSNKLYLTNLRHIDCVKTALESLNNALNNLDNMTMDVVSFELRKAWNSLGELTGQTNNENIIDKIFSKFCLGK